MIDSSRTMNRINPNRCTFIILNPYLGALPKTCKKYLRNEYVCRESTPAIFRPVYSITELGFAVNCPSGNLPTDSRSKLLLYSCCGQVLRFLLDLSVLLLKPRSFPVQYAHRWQVLLTI